MNSIVTTFEGKDLVISRERLEQLGIKPGEQVQIAPVVFLYPIKLSSEERERRLQWLDQLWGSWSARDEENFTKNRDEMWHSWTPRNSS